MEEGSGEGPLEITAPPVVRIATYPVSWYDSCVQMSRFDALYTGYIMILHRARLFYWGGIEGFDCIILYYYSTFMQSRGVTYYQEKNLLGLENRRQYWGW